MKKNIKVVEKSTKKLLSLMGVDVDFGVDEDKENEALVVEIDAKENSGLLIGNRGETLNSIQAILGMIIKSETGEWHRILVNVSDWREKQEGRLLDLATQTAERALATGDSQPLYNLSAADRRIVHMSLSEDDSVTTESQGEGKDRYLVISPKKASK